jgi:hypothetical protein
MVQRIIFSGAASGAAEKFSVELQMVQQRRLERYSGRAADGAAVEINSGWLQW